MKACPKCWGTGVPLDHKELGHRARAKRMIAKISLEDAAKRLGVSGGFLSYLETGKRRWTERMFRKAMGL